MSAPIMTEDRRWPRWIYEHGSQPDVRFTFANERTFLAWIRTALALMAAAVALDALDLGLARQLQEALAIVFIVLGCLCASASWVRWARAERAIRQQRPLPTFGVGIVLSITVLLAGLALLIAM